MASLSFRFPLIPFLFLALLSAVSGVVETDGGPQLSFAVDPENPGPPVLIKPQFNQFAPPHHHHHGNKEGEKGLSKHNFISMVHSLGIKASKHQIERLYELVKKKGKKHHNKHHHKHSHGKEGEEREEVWKEAPKDEGNVRRPLPAHLGHLPPGLGKAKPMSWGDEGEEGGDKMPSEAEKSSSPVAAAKAPLPEPANTLPPPTASGMFPSSSHLPPHPPAAAVGLNTSHTASAPVTAQPASTLTEPGGGEKGTSGSLNPSSTPPPPPPPAVVDDKRLSGLNGASTSGKNVAGIPIEDDGDAKAIQPQVGTNVTSANGKKGDKSGGSKNGKKNDVWAWARDAAIAGVVLGVLLWVV